MGMWILPFIHIRKNSHRQHRPQATDGDLQQSAVKTAGKNRAMGTSAAALPSDCSLQKRRRQPRRLYVKTPWEIDNTHQSTRESCRGICRLHFQHLNTESPQARRYCNGNTSRPNPSGRNECSTNQQLVWTGKASRNLSDDLQSSRTSSRRANCLLYTLHHPARNKDRHPRNHAAACDWPCSWGPPRDCKDKVSTARESLVCRNRRCCWEES